jgi:hypothetical protein
MSAMSRTRIAVVSLVVLALAGCSGPGDGGGATDPQEEYEAEPWLTDDLELDAAVASADYQGIEVVGFTCDKTYVTGYGGTDDHYATFSAGPQNSSVAYRDPAGLSSAPGPGIDVPAVAPGAPTFITVTGSGGYFHIGDGGENTPGWSTSMEVTLEAVPVPEGACGAAMKWALDMEDVDTGAAEMFRAFTEDGLTNLGDTCVGEYDDVYEWIPPNMTCEEYVAYEEAE